MEESQLQFYYEFHSVKDKEILFYIKMYRYYYDDECINKIFEEVFTRTELLSIGVPLNSDMGEVDDEEQVLNLLVYYFETHPQFKDNAMENISEYKPHLRRCKIHKALGKIPNVTAG